MNLDDVPSLRARVSELEEELQKARLALANAVRYHKADIQGYCADRLCDCHTVPEKMIRTPFPLEGGWPPYCCSQCARNREN